MTGSEKNLKEKKKKKNLLSSKNATTTQKRENHHFKGITHILRYLVLPSSHQHATKTKPTFEKKKRRAGGGAFAAEQRGE